jgi:hypothetical protein
MDRPRLLTTSARRLMRADRRRLPKGSPESFPVGPLWMHRGEARDSEATSASVAENGSRHAHGRPYQRASSPKRATSPSPSASSDNSSKARVRFKRRQGSSTTGLCVHSRSPPLSLNGYQRDLALGGLVSLLPGAGMAAKPADDTSTGTEGSRHNAYDRLRHEGLVRWRCFGTFGWVRWGGFFGVGDIAVGFPHWVFAVAMLAA